MVTVRSRTIQRSQFNSVPQALKDLDQWVCWRYEQRNGKRTKPPYSARGVHSKRQKQPLEAESMKVLALFLHLLMTLLELI